MPESCWTEVLDDLELRLASGDTGAWTPPVGIGPLPAALTARARRLAAAQQEAIAHAEDELRRIGTELASVRRAPSGTASRAAAYIDTVA